MANELVQQFPDAEIRDRRAEKHRRLPRGEVVVDRQLRARPFDELDFIAKFIRQIAEHRRCLGRFEPVDGPDPGRLVARAALIQVDSVLQQVIDALERAAHADRPGHRRTLDAEDGLDLVEQLDRLLAVAVELVDERHDRRVAQPAHFHQLDRALLDALAAVDHHQRRVDRRQRAVGVFGKVFVARRIEQVDDVTLVGKLHHRRGDRDAALLLERHPVGGRVPRRLAALDRARQLDRAAVQQQLLGQRRLAGVRVRDDRERAPEADLSLNFGHQQKRDSLLSGKAAQSSGVARSIKPAVQSSVTSFLTSTAASSRPLLAW